MQVALLDFLKRKKQIDKTKEKQKEKQPVKKVEKILVNEEPKDQKTEKPKNIGTKKGGFSYDAIKEPHISEKSTNLGEVNKYVFKVQNKFNKPEIKKAVEGIYGVNVLNVNIIKIPKKKRRIGKTEGFRKGYVKAVVTVKEGQKIEIY